MGIQGKVRMGNRLHIEHFPPNFSISSRQCQIQAKRQDDFPGRGITGRIRAIQVVMIESRQPVQLPSVF